MAAICWAKSRPGTTTLTSWLSETLRQSRFLELTVDQACFGMKQGTLALKDVPRQ